MKKSGNEHFEEKILANLGRILWTLATLPFKGKVKGNEVEKRWKEIQSLMQQEEPTAWDSAILKADSLLDYVLKKRTQGKTLGERLKNMKGNLNPDVYNAAWQGHLVRNRIAHEHITLSRGQAEKAIYNFRIALNGLGVL